MAPVIWGLNLGEMQWSKFKSSNMFRKDYHLRRAKMIVYQIAMIMCVVSESVGTDALSKYVDQQNFIEHLNTNAHVHNDDFVGIASYNIFVGIFVATIFGAGFFFDLFWPERHESKGVRLAWKICAVLACIMALGDALALTVIVASHSAYITGVDAATARSLLEANQNDTPKLLYRHNARAVASAVILWPGWVATVASTIILFMSHAHDDKYGPKSAHTVREEEEKAGTKGTDMSSIPDTNAGPDEYGHMNQSSGPYHHTRDHGEDAPNFMASDDTNAPEEGGPGWTNGQQSSRLT